MSLSCAFLGHLSETIGGAPFSVRNTKETVVPIGGLVGCRYCSRGERNAYVVIPASYFLESISKRDKFELAREALESGADTSFIQGGKEPYQ